MKNIILPRIDFPADKNLVEIVSKSLEDFTPIFESLESAKTPTMHLVVKNYKEIHRLMDKWERQVEPLKKHLKRSNSTFDFF